MGLAPFIKRVLEGLTMSSRRMISSEARASDPVRHAVTVDAGNLSPGPETGAA